MRRLATVVLVCVLATGVGMGAVGDDPRVAGSDSPRLVAAVDALDAINESSNSSAVTIEGDDPGVDVDRAYSRVQALTGGDLPELTTRFNRDGGVDLRETHPDPLLGVLADPSVRIVRPVRGAASTDRVSVSYEDDAPPERIERVLTHELAHAAQPSTLREDLAAAAGERADTTDAALAREAVAEGAAVYLADEYVERYLDVPTQSETIADEWPSMATGTRILWAPYRYGAEHAHARASSPADLSAIYDEPPLTTAQVLHPERVGTDPPPLAVDVDDQNWDEASVDTKGELYLRVLLASELGERRAASAASGWANDRSLIVEEGSDRAIAWVIQWEDPDDAEAFEAAMADYLNATAIVHGDGWFDGESAFRLGAVTERTTYLLVGDPGFVNSATVEGIDTNVTVEG